MDDLTTKIDRMTADIASLKEELKELKAQLAALCEGPERDGRDPDEGARGLCQGEG